MTTTTARAYSAPARAKWVSDKFLAEYFDVSRRTIWRWAQDGRLPSPSKINGTAARWDFDAIRERFEAGTAA